MKWEKRLTKKALAGSNSPEIAGIDAARRRAAKRALQIGLETGTPVYFLEKGTIVDLTKRYRRKKTRSRKSKSRNKRE